MKSAKVIWKPIKGYENLYEISSSGLVRGLIRVIKTISHGNRKFNSKILKSRLNNYGYEEVRLSKNGISKTHFIHRLIAENFISNPDNKKEVNHKNGIKDDNRIENLEWVTHSENMIHAYKNGLIKKSRKKKVKVNRIFNLLKNPSFKSRLVLFENYRKSAKKLNIQVIVKLAV